MTNILTAEQFNAQGTSPWAVISIARSHMTKDKRGNPAGDTPTSLQLRRVAGELAALTGVSMGRSVPQATAAAKPANDNRRDQRPQYKRAA